jgi:hypothetical protein
MHLYALLPPFLLFQNELVIIKSFTPIVNIFLTGPGAHHLPGAVTWAFFAAV